MASSKRRTPSSTAAPARPVAAQTGSVLTPHWLARVLREQLGLAQDATLMLAYSGGLDSEALLHLLAGLHRDTGWPVRAVHVDHGLSPDATRWIAHCTARCRALAVPLTVERVQVTTGREEGLEAAARRARYGALRRHVGARDALLTAQHQRDQAETLLLRLLRGAGCQGMAAMSPRVPFGEGWLVRPLLEVQREAIEKYAQTHSLAWVEDAMNRDPALARGFLRENVMPALRRFWPAADAQLARAACHAAEAAALLDEMAAADLDHCRVDDRGTLSIGALTALSPLRRKNALRLWFAKEGRARPSSRHLAQIVRAIEQPSATARAIVRERGAEVRRYRDRLVLAAVRPPVSLRGWHVQWDPKRPLVLPGHGGTLRAVSDSGRGLSLTRLGGRLFDVRFRRGGETCELPGRGHHHKVKKLLQEAGIPPWEREAVPLLYVDDELAAVGERWVCAPYAAAGGEPSLRLVIDRAPD